MYITANSTTHRYPHVHVQPNRYIFIYIHICSTQRVICHLYYEIYLDKFSFSQILITNFYRGDGGSDDDVVKSHNQIKAPEETGKKTRKPIKTTALLKSVWIRKSATVVQRLAVC